LGRAISGRVMVRSFGMTQSMAWHKILWVVPAQHEHKGHVVSRISARQATRAGPHFRPCLDRLGTKMAHRHFYNYATQFSNICYIISHLILKCITEIIKTFIKIVHTRYIYFISRVKKNSRGYFESHAWTEG
jgi:hypothetical protein